MGLLAVRQQFAELSGLHYLVTDFSAGTYTNNAGNIGADYFLNMGQKMLDRKTVELRKEAWYKIDVVTGSTSRMFPNCKVIKEVWMIDSSGGRHELEKKTERWMRSAYEEPFSGGDDGTPIYYAPLLINLGPGQIALTSSNYTDEFTRDEEGILFSDVAEDFNYKGILWMPPADEGYTLAIRGRFDSPTLTADVSTFWTEMHPEILIQAGQWAVEVTYRNTQGMNDFMAPILDAIADLDKDVVEQQIQDVTQMEG